MWSYNYVGIYDGDYFEHRSYKYISKKRGNNGKWQYKYDYSNKNHQTINPVKPGDKIYKDLEDMRLAKSVEEAEKEFKKAEKEYNEAVKKKYETVTDYLPSKKVENGVIVYPKYDRKAEKAAEKAKRKYKLTEKTLKIAKDTYNRYKNKSPGIIDNVIKLIKTSKWR